MPTVRVYAGQSASVELCGADAVVATSPGLQPEMLTGPAGACSECANRTLADVAVITRDYDLEGGAGACGGLEAAVASLRIWGAPPAVKCVSNCSTNHVYGGAQVASPVECMVSLQAPPGEHHCGGTLIARGVVLTAAHCAVGIPELQGPFSALVGALDTQAGVPGSGVGMPHRSARYEVTSWIPHPLYAGGGDAGYAHDVAIVLLGKVTAGATPAEQVFATGPWTSHLAPPSSLPGNLANNARLAILGWGLQQTGGSAAEMLQNATVPFVPRGECLRNAAASSYGGVTDDTVCAGELYVTDTCSGDSGGPLFLLGGSDGTTFEQQVGLTSHGAAACGGARDSVYGDYASTYEPVNAQFIMSHVALPASATASPRALAPGAGASGVAVGPLVALPSVLASSHVLLAVLLARMRAKG